MPSTPGCPLQKVEVLLLALVLVAAYHAIPYGLLALLPTKALYDRVGENGFGYFWNGLTLLMPLLLCIGAPSRCGLRVGTWTSRGWKVLGICILPVILTAAIYPFTSQPFAGAHVGMWLISPTAQDLLFTGYLYGVLDTAFPGSVHRRLRLSKAMLLTAAYFASWHVPNFLGIDASYVLFQLFYTFVGGAWVLLARQLTGSVLPGIATHMAVNFIACAGW